MTQVLELLVRLVCSLALVVGLLLLAARFANRKFRGGAGSTIRVLHRQPIGKGTAVSVVSVGTRILVLGATEQSVSLLTEVEPDEIGLDEAELLVLDAPGQLEAGAPLLDGLDEVDQPGGLEDADLPVTTPAPGGGRLPGVPSLIPTGSVLSPQTWRQAYTALTGAAARRAS